MSRTVATFSLSLIMLAASLAQTWFELSIVYPEPSVSRNFGTVMDIEGDTLIVSDFENFEKGRDYGATFVYQREGVSWNLETTWSPEDLGFSPEFGTSLALDSDTVAIGAPSADFTISEGFRGEGQVFVYQREGTEWTGPTVVFPNDQSRGDYGAAVALSGNTLAVGAPSRNASAGEVVIYQRNGRAWEEVIILQDVEERRSIDAFGQALVFADDSTLVVGIPGKDNRDGAVAIFALQGGTWKHSQTLRIDNPEFSTRFGQSLAYENGKLLIGAPDEDGFGSAHLYEREGDTWTFRQKLTASNKDLGDKFGSSVAISGDTILVGAPEEDAVGFFPNRNQTDNTLRNTGAAYHFTKTGNSWEETGFLKSPSGDDMGSAVAIAGELSIVGGSNEFTTFEPSTPREFTELQLTVYSPDIETVLAGPGTFGFNEPWPIRILNSLFSTTANSLRLDFTGHGTFSEGECVCVVVEDTLNSWPDLTQATIDPSSTLAGFDASRLQFDANSITVNAQGLAFEDGNVLLINLEFAGQSGEPVTLTHYERDGSKHVIDFTSAVARNDWQVQGSPNLKSPFADHTISSIFTSLKAGRYRAIVDLPQVTSPSYFFTIR